MKLNVSWFLASLVILIAFSPLVSHRAGASTLSASEVVSEINKERSARGLSALRLDNALSASADKRSSLLVRLGDLVHVSSPSGTSWPELVEAGYINTYAGENLALGLETPEALVREWMNSPSHRANILGSNYTDIGIGVTTGSYRGASRPVSYVVAFFSSARNNTPSSSVSIPPSVTRRVVPKPQVVHEKVVEKKTSGATVVAPDVSPVVMAAVSEPTPPSDSSHSVEEEISVLKRLIALLESYLAIFLTSQRA